MAGRKFQHLPLRGASLTKFCAFCICLKIFFYLVWLCTICVLLFALVNRTNPRRNKIVHSLMSVTLNQVLVFFSLKNSRIPISQTTPPPSFFCETPVDSNQKSFPILSLHLYLRFFKLPTFSNQFSFPW